MRTARIIGEGASYYHCITRVIEKRMRLNNMEKERFRKILRKVADFSGVEILTYALMNNHIHLLLMVPERYEIPEEEVLRRIQGLYGRNQADEVARQLAEYRKDGLEEAAAELLKHYTYRMNDLSEFMKMVLQRFTQSYNKRHERRGTLWEDRFKSLLVEGKANALSMTAAYIDLNAVRAGIVKDPKDYRFCGYGEAVAGERAARDGVRHICRVLGCDGGWGEVSKAYRTHLFMQGAEHQKRGIKLEAGRIREVLESGGKLSKAELLQCRIRYLSDGVVLGSKAFVEDVFARYRERFGLKRKTGARKPRFGEWGGLCTMRDLRVNPVSIST